MSTMNMNIAHLYRFLLKRGNERYARTPERSLRRLTYWGTVRGLGGSINTANCTKNYAQNNIKKPPTALKLISKYRKPLCFVKPQYRNLK